MRITFAVLFSLFTTPVWANCANHMTVADKALAQVAPDCASEDGACRWSFDLADTESRDLFDALRGSLETCEALAKEQDKGVNHPDFYDAWIYTFADHALSVSLKDKAALKQTFVVIRTLPLP